MARVENKTGRSVRSIEIASELFDNGYYFCDTVQVDYSDDVYMDDLADSAADLEHVADSPGPRMLVTIECTSAGITID